MADSMQKLTSYKPLRASVIALIVLIAVLVLGGALWSLCMVTIDPGMVGIVFHERGEPDPAGHFIVEEGYKGIQREVLEPGLHFFPLTTTFMEITQVPMTVVPEGKVGVLIAQDGRPLPEGAVLAEDDQFDENGNLVKMGQIGIRKEILKPGTHLINTEYFQVELADAFYVPSGKIGVLKREIGDSAPPGQILVSLEDNYRGYIREVQEPGLRYFHPKIYSWDVVDALNIPPGKVGVLTRKIGDAAPAGQRLVPRDSNYRGI
ncbi:hypothetical protein GF339_22820, partial [candidate division KSB3 bacterium]|nr:hypothetical protein [candidate division KSB3 bacterium]MBD3327437.1 hypothetical protein [candidate division KSB3 bacterium]